MRCPKENTFFMLYGNEQNRLCDYPKMRVIHSGTLDVNFGGPAMSTYLSIVGSRHLGIDAEMFMYQLPKDGKLRGEDIPIHFTPAPIVPKILYSPKYKTDLRKLGDFDIYHTQNIWTYPTYGMIDVAREKKLPYLVTPRGMLYPQDIQKNNSWLKKFSLRYRLLDDMNRAACIQTTCEEEMQHCRELGVTSPVAIIPNPIDIRDITQKKQDDIFRLAYLGRLSRRKNVESLIYTFAEHRNRLNDAELIIIGGGDQEYENFLKEEVQRLNLTNVRFLGFLSGEEKDKALASASVVAMPSEFENFGNVVPEGLMRRIPCIATKGAPWKELESHHCGWWVDYRQDAIAEAILQAKSLSRTELEEMGERGRHLMEENYAVDKIAAKLKCLYEWILGEAEKPSFVYE